MGYTPKRNLGWHKKGEYECFTLNYITYVHKINIFIIYLIFSY